MDTLKITKALEGVGFTRDQADTLAHVISDHVRDEAVTKADLSEVGKEMHKTLGDFRVSVLMWVGGMLIAQLGAIFAMLHNVR